MKTYSPSLPAALVTRSGFLQKIMLWLEASAAEHRARRRMRETAELLAQMDEHLLDDIGVSRQQEASAKSAMKELAEMHPAYLAAMAFSAPRQDRR